MTDPGETAVDASSLYQHPVFRCSSLAQSQAYLRTALSDHALKCGTGEVDSALYTTDTGRVQMMVLRYGPEVEITPRPFEGFSLVQIPLSGYTEIECDGHRVQLAPGDSALISPRRQLKLLWSRNCEQLIVRVPHSLVDAAAQTRESWRRALQHRRQVLAPITRIDGVPGRRWNALVQSLIDLTALGQEGADPCHPAWKEHSELGLAVYLLTLQHDFAEPRPVDEDEQERRAAAGRGDPLAAAERYVRSRLCAPIALEDLARAAGVSARTLHVHCKRWHGVGPMEWLRNVRLDVARDKLQQSRSAQVTEVALSCGFGHLGRFSAYYRERFGELPRDTSVKC
jgi:AraC-like DNA-binding protein